MEKTVLTTLSYDEFEMLIIDCVSACLKVHSKIQANHPSPAQAPILGFEEAVRFLNDQGLPVSQTMLKELVSSKEIPVKLFAGKEIFLRSQLQSWVDAQVDDLKNPRFNSTTGA